MRRCTGARRSAANPTARTARAPENQSAWDLFERHAGRKVALLNMRQAWVTFDKTEMDLTWNRGAIPVVTMGLANGVTLEQVAAGGQDSAIKSWAAAAKAWGHPFLLAPWWEMNGDWFVGARSALRRRLATLPRSRRRRRRHQRHLGVGPEQPLVRPAFGPGALLPRRRLRGLDRDRQLQLGAQPGPAQSSG